VFFFGGGGTLKPNADCTKPFLGKKVRNDHIYTSKFLLVIRTEQDSNNILTFRQIWLIPLVNDGNCASSTKLKKKNLAVSKVQVTQHLHK
jgi:hypothetical protein